MIDARTGLAKENHVIWNRALSRWTWILVATVFPLIWVGGLVTTTDAGMAVPDWPNTYGYNMFLYPVYDWFFGPWDLFVEHGHRLLACLAGIFTIIVAVLAWRQRADRPVFARLSLLALAMIIAQGALGGMRVVLDARTLALIHGCLGPTFFVVTVAMACSASRWWCQLMPSPVAISGTGTIPLGLGVLLLVASLVQLFLGANLRHVPVTASPYWFEFVLYGHVGTAILLLIGVAALVVLSRSDISRMQGVLRLAIFVASATGMQVALGVGTWVVNYAWPSILDENTLTGGYVIAQKGFWQTNIVTAHVAAGSAIAGLLGAVVCRCYHVRRTFGSCSAFSGNDLAVSDAVKTGIGSPSTLSGVNC
jgi:heme a synthase